MSKYGLPKHIVELENHVGHWAIGTGASRLVDEVRESRKIAKRVHEILTAGKVPSTYFQDDTSKNKDQNLKTLVAHHNQDVNGLVTSYHLNASGGVVDESIGVEVLYVNDTLKPLAIDLANAIADAAGIKNRGAKKRDNLYVLNATKEPAILIETFFVNSRKDVEQYNKNFEAICRAIAKVLAEAVNQTIEPIPVAPAIRKLNINSPALNDIASAILSSKAQRELIVNAAIKNGMSAEWKTKLDNKTITDDELLALAAKTIVDINK